MNVRSFVLFLCLFAPVSAMAADVQDMVKKACTADAKANCAWVLPGGGRMIGCFVKNAGKLSAGCKAALSTASCEAKAPANLKAAFPCAG